MRRLVALTLALCPSIAAADVVVSYTEQIGFSPYYSPSASLFVGSGDDGIERAYSDTFDLLNMSGLPGRIASIQIGGSVDDLRPHPYLVYPTQPFANIGVYASLYLSVGGFTVGATDPASLFAERQAGAASASVDDGIANPGTGTELGPDFSITLGQAAVDLANADLAAGQAFGLMFTGQGFSVPPEGSSVFGNMTFTVTITAAPVPEPSSLALCGLALAWAAGRGRRGRGPLAGRA